MLQDNFELTETLHESDYTVIYKAKSKSDHQKVIIKACKKPEDVHRLKHAYEILRGKKIEGIVNALDFIYDEYNAYLVLEDKDAIVLDSYAEAEEMDEKRFVTIAKNAAYALSTIHEHGILHKDIKPSNMLIDAETLAVYYIDFGISSMIDDKDNVAKDDVQGTIEYVAPEQTGRINASIDERSDLYSLGITLYKLISSRLPFSGNSNMEIIHAHIAVTPDAPSDYADISETTSNIILKLLKKSPSERYQSAESLEDDWSRCVEALEEGTKIAPFTLGESDILLKFSLEKKLYGKEKEFLQLKEIFDRASAGRGELVILKGLPSAGKTKLVSALEKYMNDNNSFLSWGEFEENERNEPFYAIREAFERFYLFLKNGGYDLAAFRAMLANAFGGNGQVVINLFPFTESFMGKQPPLVTLGYVENQKRTEKVFTDLVQVFCRPSFPIVIFLDNIQWADYYSLRLLLAALSDKDTRNCLVIWAMRSDSDTSDDVTAIFNELEDASFRVSTIDVPYLNRLDIRSIIADIFQQSPQAVSELADYTFEVTGGKPLEVTYFLRSLYDNKVIVYDNADDSWVWDMETVKLADINLDMDQEFIRTLNSLPERVRKTVIFLSYCGSEFSLDYVMICCNNRVTEDEFHEHVKVLIRNDILFYDRISATFAFVNSRMHRLCYNLSDHETKKNLNSFIGKNLLAFYRDDKKGLYDHCAEIADHLNFPDEIELDAEDSMLVAELNLMAGNKSLSNSVASQAIVSFARGIEFLGEKPFSRNYKIAFELFLNLTDCYFALADMKQTQVMYDIIFENVANPQDRYMVYHKRMEQYFSAVDYVNTIQIGMEFLKDTGLLLDETKDFSAMYEQEHHRFLENLKNKDIECFLTSGYAKDETIFQNGSILSLMTSSYFLSNHIHGDYYIFRTFDLAYKHGVFHHFEKVLEIAAIRRAGMGEFLRAERISNVSLLYADQYNAPKANVYLYYGMTISHWLYPISKTLDIYREAKSAAMAEGNVHTSSLADGIMFDTYAYMGMNLTKYMREVNTAIEYARKVGHEFSAYMYSSVYKQYARCLLGKTFASDSFEDKYFNEVEFLSACHDSEYMLAYYYSYKLQALCLHGHYEAVLAITEKLEPISRAMGSVLPIVQNNFCHSFALIRLCQGDPDKKEEYMELIVRNQVIMEEWAKYSPENFMHKYLIIDFGLKRLEGNSIELLLKSAEIQKLIDKGQFILDAAVFEEILFRYWDELKVPQYMDHHKRAIFHMYSSMEANVKAWQYTYEDDVGSNRGTYSTMTSGTTHTSATGLSNKSLDAETILQVMTSLGYDLDITAISERFLSVIIQSSGADKGFLITTSNERIVLEAVNYSESSSENIKPSMLPAALDEIDPKRLPTDIFSSVLTKKTIISAHAATNNYMFYVDAYIRKNEPKSFICLPIVAKNNLIGAIYLENAKLQGVFTEERIDLISTITMQSAIIIQNAIYYNEISAYAKTVELRLKEHIGQLNALIAGIAHEINSPVGVCVTVISRMQELSQEITEKFKAAKLSKGNLAEFLDETEKGLTIAIANITRAADLIQNFKKVSVDQSTEVFENLNLRDTLQNIVEYIRPAIKKNVNQIDIMGPENLIVYSCSGTLTQIFTNLIMNASLHAFEEMDKEKCKVTIKFTQQEGHVQIIFTDNGKGMSDEQLEKLFQPFYTTKRNKGGSGLGAHIILTLVTQTLSGSINCVSTLGKGTSFIINLPQQIKQEGQLN